MGGAVGAIQLVTQIAVESNLAVSTIFALIKGVRDAWPKKIVDAEGNVVEEPPLPDAQLTAIMEAEFSKNSARNAELQAEIRAGNLPTG